LAAAARENGAAGEVAERSFVAGSTNYRSWPKAEVQANAVWRPRAAALGPGPAAVAPEFFSSAPIAYKNLCAQDRSKGLGDCHFDLERVVVVGDDEGVLISEVVAVEAREVSVGRTALLTGGLVYGIGYIIAIAIAPALILGAASP
jgi:hypothetical protein